MECTPIHMFELNFGPIKDHSAPMWFLDRLDVWTTRPLKFGAELSFFWAEWIRAEWSWAEWTISLINRAIKLTINIDTLTPALLKEKRFMNFDMTVEYFSCINMYKIMKTDGNIFF